MVVKRLHKLVAIGALLLLAMCLLIPPSPAGAEEGRATWYGPGFHGKRMSNGQIYNMYDPTTTACNLYPLGTWLRVTNLANGKSIIVQVRDRGAFRHALDLSYAAFSALGGAVGYMKVSYEVVPGPDASEEKPAPTPTPSPTPTPELTPTPASQPAAPADHVVQAGETLSDIAARYGLSIEELANINGLDDLDFLREGQHLRLSAGGEGEDVSLPEDTVDVSAAASSEEISGSPLVTGAYYHTVQEGETLWGIALQYGLTADDLEQLNQLEDGDSLQVGQQLYVSQLYEVAEGDTLGSIAADYGVTLEALMAANSLTDEDLIHPGTELRIPEP